ncbi:MAG: hypothetical protein AAB341_01730 [Planctomycetota bacterium]|jgi:hypothetical protein
MIGCARPLTRECRHADCRTPDTGFVSATILRAKALRTIAVEEYADAVAIAVLNGKK